MSDQDRPAALKGAKAFSDLADLPEDDRITIMGELAERGSVVSVVVDDIPGKLDRYLQKLTTRFKVEEVERGIGPVKHTVYAKIGPRTEGAVS